MMAYLYFFLGWLAGMGACWLLWDGREKLKQRREAAGEREAHEAMKAQFRESVEKGEALVLPQAPPRRPSPRPRATPQPPPADCLDPGWPYGRHAVTDGEVTGTMPVIEK